MFKSAIKVERFIIAIFFVFVIADSVPHPGLSQGILATVLSRDVEIGQK